MKWTSSSMTLMLDVHLKSYRALYFGVRLLLWWILAGWEIPLPSSEAGSRGRRKSGAGGRTFIDCIFQIYSTVFRSTLCFESGQDGWTKTRMGQRTTGQGTGTGVQLYSSRVYLQGMYVNYVCTCMMYVCEVSCMWCVQGCSTVFAFHIFTPRA